ncbi:hypothetical protein [Paenibacillus sp. USHLN196]|uniref:hypothetical protein n=1 Tax=Paenibacillus sp. USHLN196 TaxID=3081291 RepID=UPI00301709BA
MIYSVTEDDKNIPKLRDVNGKLLEMGDKFRMYSSVEDCYGRPVLLAYVDDHYVTDILNYNNNYGIHFYLESARLDGWDTFEITE